ncbi:hypothetical protein L0F63_002616, partial [Massospora cicadina]
GFNDRSLRSTCMGNCVDDGLDFNLDRLVYKSGVDHHGNPMILICLCNLPNPATHDYDGILDAILLRLHSLVESRYTCLIFAGGSRYPLGWRVIYRAYRRLTHSLRKNLQAMYVVHPNYWVRLIYSFMGYFVSGKFERKLVWVDSLSELRGHVSLAHVDIPEAVYRYNLQFEDPTPNSGAHEPVAKPAGKLFGNSLESMMGACGEKGIPAFVNQCMEYTLSKAYRLIPPGGLLEEGLFRCSPALASLNEAKSAFEKGEAVDLSSYEVHVAATLLKMFTRDLREPIFPESSYGSLPKLSQMDSDEQRVEYIRSHVMPLLPLPNQVLLSYLCKSLSKIAQHQHLNKMDSLNLSLVWTPNLLRSSNPMLDMSLCTQNGATFATVLRLAIDHHGEVFSHLTKEAFSPQPPQL